MEKVNVNQRNEVHVLQTANIIMLVGVALVQANEQELVKLEIVLPSYMYTRGKHFSVKYL